MRERRLTKGQREGKRARKWKTGLNELVLSRKNKRNEFSSRISLILCIYAIKTQAKPQNEAFVTISSSIMLNLQESIFSLCECSSYRLQHVLWCISLRRQQHYILKNIICSRWHTEPYSSTCCYNWSWTDLTSKINPSQPWQLCHDAASMSPDKWSTWPLLDPWCISHNDTCACCWIQISVFS